MLCVLVCCRLVVGTCWLLLVVVGCRGLWLVGIGRYKWVFVVAVFFAGSCWLMMVVDVCCRLLLLLLIVNC